MRRNDQKTSRVHVNFSLVNPNLALTLEREYDLIKRMTVRCGERMVIRL